MPVDSTIPPQDGGFTRRRREIDGQTELIMRKSIKRRGTMGFIRPRSRLAPTDERVKASRGEPSSRCFPLCLAAALLFSAGCLHGALCPAANTWHSPASYGTCHQHV